jgi:hypothetical protein
MSLASLLSTQAENDVAWSRVFASAAFSADCRPALHALERQFVKALRIVSLCESLLISDRRGTLFEFLSIDTSGRSHYSSAAERASAVDACLSTFPDHISLLGRTPSTHRIFRPLPTASRDECMRWNALTLATQAQRVWLEWRHSMYGFYKIRSPQHKLMFLRMLLCYSSLGVADAYDFSFLWESFKHDFRKCRSAKSALDLSIVLPSTSHWDDIFGLEEDIRDGSISVTSSQEGRQQRYPFVQLLDRLSELFPRPEPSLSGGLEKETSFAEFLFAELSFRAQNLLTVDMQRRFAVHLCDTVQKVVSVVNSWTKSQITSKA